MMTLVVGVDGCSSSPASEVLPKRLYLGDFASADRSALDAITATHVVPVMPAFYTPRFPKVFQYHQVIALDTVKQDLLESFPSCCRFIDAALADGGVVLVHW
eukprot:TRINITY_DN4181_c0_g1_i1.p2 TRINITY_DN4181_c0_g1~~TRINITY_DN4181_c0_g1_i1.p2  ORF type:complete len:102 (-),score=24.36 TRINITY_DN4181_c0_g1_i1:427-732(-)